MPSERALPVRPAALAALRAVAVAAWLGGGAGTVALVYPLVGRWHRQRLKQRWSAGLLRILGIQVRVQGHPAAGGLVVANHVSWVDVFALNALVPAAFVAKEEVRDWPLIGWLCTHTETLFIRRGSARQAHALTRAMRFRLAAGATLAVFPEGTSTRGDSVLPFMPAVFEGAVEAAAPVRPVALGYRCGSAWTDAPSYAGQTGLLESIWRILRVRHLAVCLDWLPPIDAGVHDRRNLAVLSERSIRAASGAAQRKPVDGPAASGLSDRGVVA